MDFSQKKVVGGGILGLLVSFVVFDAYDTYVSTKEYERKRKEIQDKAKEWFLQALRPYREENFRKGSTSMWLTTYKNVEDPLYKSQLTPIRLELINGLQNIAISLPYSVVEQVCGAKAKADSDTFSVSSDYAECILRQIWDPQLRDSKAYVNVDLLRRYATPSLMLNLVSIQWYFTLPLDQTNARAPQASDVMEVYTNTSFPTAYEKQWIQYKASSQVFATVSATAFHRVCVYFNYDLSFERATKIESALKQGSAISFEELELFLIAKYIHENNIVLQR